MVSVWDKVRMTLKLLWRPLLYPISPLSPFLELWCKLDALIRTRSRTLIAALSQRNAPAMTKSTALGMTLEWCQTSQQPETLINNIHLTVARLKKKNFPCISLHLLSNTFTRTQWYTQRRNNKVSRWCCPDTQQLQRRDTQPLFYFVTHQNAAVGFCWK